MSDPVLEIDRIPLTIVAASSAERAERISRRARDALASSLSAALATACERDLEDEGYVFIDRLEVECAVATHWSDDSIASAFSAQVARALQLDRSLGRGVSFRDRAEYLAAFLIATVEGHASGRWWFSELAGLAPLPPSAAIRTLVNDEGTTGWEALARLTPNALSRVVSYLEEADAERIVAAVTGAAPASMEIGDLITSLTAVREIQADRRAARLVLALATLARQGSTIVSAPTVATVRGVLTILDAVGSGRLDIDGAAGPADLRAWGMAAGLDEASLRGALSLDAPALVEFLAAQVPRSDDLDTGPGQRFVHTRYGGGLILAAVLDRMGWWPAWRAVLDGAAAGDADLHAAWLGLAITARALAPDDVAAVEDDAGLRIAFGIPADHDSRRRSTAVTRAMAAALGTGYRVAGAGAVGVRLEHRLRARAADLLRELGRRVPGLDGSSPAYLRRECLALTARVRADGGLALVGRPPLDVLLRFSGLKRTTVAMPDGRRLEFVEDLSE